MMKLLIMLFFIYSCSQGGESKPVTGPVIQKDPLEEEMSGLYQALLAPVNKKISGHLNGALTLVKEDDEFIADVRFSGGPPSVLHTQHIHF